MPRSDWDLDWAPESGWVPGSVLEWRWVPVSGLGWVPESAPELGPELELGWASEPELGWA